MLRPNCRLPTCGVSPGAPASRPPCRDRAPHASSVGLSRRQNFACDPFPPPPPPCPLAPPGGRIPKLENADGLAQFVWKRCCYHARFLGPAPGSLNNPRRVKKPGVSPRWGNRRKSVRPPPIVHGPLPGKPRSALFFSPGTPTLQFDSHDFFFGCFSRPLN